MNLETLRRTRSAHFLLKQAQEEIAATMARRDVAPRLDFGQLVLTMSTGGRHDGGNREALQEFARNAGLAFDPQRVTIPFSEFRDLTAAVSGSGGFLVSSETQESVDILRPWSVTARAGVQVETGLQGDQVVPKVTAKSTPAWLPTEGTQITPSTPTLVQIAMTPKSVGSIVNFSRQFAKQANASGFVQRELVRTVGTAFDQAVENGSGAAGQPTGLTLTAGVQTQSGTTLNSGVNTMKQKCASANVNDAAIAFLSTPAVRETLENRERVTGSGRFVWDRETVADRPAYVSTDMPTATMICGDFGNVYVGIWGEAFQFEINPYDTAAFKAGGIQGRIILTCDVAVLHPAGFVLASSIT